MPTGRNRASDGLTPIPTVFLDDLQLAVKTIKTEVIESKTKLGEARDEVIRLQEQMRLTDKQLAELRDDIRVHLQTPAHDQCMQEQNLRDLEDEQRVLLQKTATNETNVGSISAEIVSIKGSSARFAYWLAGAAIVVIGAAVGWIVTLNVLKTEVAYLKEQQQTIQDRLVVESGAARNNDRRVEGTLERVETALKTAADHDITIPTSASHTLPEVFIEGRAPAASPTKARAVTKTAE